MVGLMWMLLIVAYILYAIAFYKLAQKADLYSIAWYAFVPFLSTVLRLRLIKWRPWWVFVLLVPIVDLVFIVIWQIRLLKAFNKHVFWIIIQITFPIIYNIVWVYWGFSAETEYVLIR